jgi:hypothetical protein
VEHSAENGRSSGDTGFEANGVESEERPD